MADKSEYPQSLERAAHSLSTSKLDGINPKSRTTDWSLRFPDYPAAQHHGPLPEMAYDDAAMPDTANSYTDSNLPTLPSDLHILIVEDNLIKQKVTALGLRKADCTVHVANHGVECLAFLNKCYCRQHAVPRISISGELLDNDGPSTTKIPLSVILLDQEMLVMNRLTCIRRIRGMQRSGELSGHIPVIAYMSNARRK
jgi:CheY-like chemotaxis protein